MIKLPGLIDPHVHLREPGGTHKEDFSTGTAAALAGGFTIVLTMPNTTPPLTDSQSLSTAKTAARAGARCDYGLYLGAGTNNTAGAAGLAESVCGLKMYLDATFGPLRMDDVQSIRRHLEAWPKHCAAAAHAESRSMAAAILAAQLTGRPLHICHVSLKEEIELIRDAKEQGFKVTCEVTPHHLFFSRDDLTHLPPGRREVRPVLAEKQDRQALWENIDVIDCFATDHAPHTAEEKDSDSPPPGFPGLETALGLYLSAVADGRLTMDQLLEKTSANPRRIFHLPGQRDTRVEVDENETWEVHAQNLHTRCGWTPYEGLQLRGKVRRVVLRGETAYEDGAVLAVPGYGNDLFSSKGRV